MRGGGELEGDVRSIVIKFIQNDNDTHVMSIQGTMMLIEMGGDVPLAWRVRKPPYDHREVLSKVKSATTQHQASPQRDTPT